MTDPVTEGRILHTVYVEKGHVANASGKNHPTTVCDQVPYWKGESYRPDKKSAAWGTVQTLDSVAMESFKCCCSGRRLKCGVTVAMSWATLAILPRRHKYLTALQELG